MLNPAPDEASDHLQDRSLVLLFHAGMQTLLWAGRIDPPLQQELLAAYPGPCGADLLVLDPDARPETAWLRALGVRHWLQFPRRDRQLNVADGPPPPDSCQTWPLGQTGAVEIFFPEPGKIALRPWTALPGVH